MELLIFIVLVILAATIIAIVSRINEAKALKARILAAFGSVPNNDDANFKSIGAYAKAVQQSDARIDEITWNDLDMDKVFNRINACGSSVGEEYLYNCLHVPKFEEATLLEREEIINFFEAHPEERYAALEAFAKLGKMNNNGITSLIFDGEYKMLRGQTIFNILAVMPFIFVAAIPFSINIGIGGLILSFIVNCIVHYRSIRYVNIEIPSIGYFAGMMKCCKRLNKIEPFAALKVMQGLRKPYNVFKNVITKAPTRKVGMNSDMAEAAWIYISILFLYDIRHYNNFMKQIAAYQKEFHQIYVALGEIDASLSILSFRKSLGEYTTPQFHTENTLQFENIFHPLIIAPVTNTGEISFHSLITGSNASGKSTFIKTLAINGILAQTIYTCSAKKFATRFVLTVTSMALRDDLLAGESYFIVEIKSLKRILELVKKYPCTCYIDEILRGTNTTERIAASAAVLEFLQTQNCLCIAASHDIELTKILPHTNFHFRESVTGNGITFDYKLKHGHSTTRNAIKLLEVMGFESEIVENAKKMAEIL